MQIFRLHVRPGGGRASVKDTFEYCLRNKLLGIGWKVGALESTKEWQVFQKAALAANKRLAACKYIKDRVRSGDLVWTRDDDANYYLARVSSGWEYFVTPESSERGIDIANVFRCQLLPVKVDAVPGKVVACFRASRTMQRIDDRSTMEYSMHLWNTLAADNAYSIDEARCRDVFSMLDAEETEDVVFLYLQTKGWYVIPNSRKGDTMRYEFFLVRPGSKESAGVQVKTGNTPVDLNGFSRADHKTYVFQPKNKYKGNFSDKVLQIHREEIEEFLKNSVDWLPDNIKHKMGLVKLPPLAISEDLTVAS